jgi:hypothetical protein
VDRKRPALWNVVLGPDAVSEIAAAAGSRTRADKEVEAREATRAIVDFESPRASLCGRKHSDDEGPSQVLLRPLREAAVRAHAHLRCGQPRGVTMEEHPFVRRLAEDMQASGVRVIVFKGP